jgi:hypothetical protein
MNTSIWSICAVDRAEHSEITISLYILKLNQTQNDILKY